MSAYPAEREVAVGTLGQRADAERPTPFRRVQLAAEFRVEFAKRCAEAMAAHAAQAQPDDVRNALKNLARGEGLKGLATIFAAAADPAVSVPLAAASRLAQFPALWMQARHHETAPECWHPTALLEAHEAEEAANHALNVAQMRERTERSVSSLVHVAELADVQTAQTQRLARVARSEIARRASAAPR